MAVQDDFRLYPGDDATVEWSYRRNGAPFDFTGVSARMAIRRQPADTGALFELSTADGGIMLTSGVITCYFDGAQTALLNSGPAHFDLQLTMADGSEKTLFYGRVWPDTPDGEVTR